MAVGEDEGGEGRCWRKEFGAYGSALVGLVGLVGWQIFRITGT